MGLKTTVKAVLKQQSEPIKLKKLARLVKEELAAAEATVEVTKEAVVEACSKLAKANLQKGLAWYTREGTEVVKPATKRALDSEDGEEQAVSKRAKPIDRENDTGTKGISIL